MRKNITKALILSALCCLTVSVCSTAYAATKNSGTAEESVESTEAAKEETKNTSAQEALNLLADLISGKSGAEDPDISADTKADGVGNFFRTAAEKEPRVITVSASGTSKAVPDKAEISFGVTSQAKTADAAQTENAKTIDAVIAHLKERGIEEKSIQTSSYNLYPEYDYNSKTPSITGYTVRTTLTVSDQAIDDAGDIVSECVALGINNVENFRFYASSYDEAYEEALQKAVKAAGAKAEVLAKSAGGGLGEILSITEGYQDTSYRYSKSRYAVEEAAAADNAAGFGMAVMPGEASIQAQVTVTYELK